MRSIDQDSTPHSKPAPFESLPTELLEGIFDFIRHDIASLKACSTVCHLLRPSCQARIFHTANFEVFNFKRGLGPISSHCRFLDIVSTSLYLASLVQELRFIRPRGPYITQHRASEEETVVRQAVVAQILLALPELTTLVIRHQGGLLTWVNLSPALTTALFKVVKLPTLRHLDLGVTYNVPTAFFKSLTNLQVLRLSERRTSLNHTVKALVTMDHVRNPSYDRFERGHLRSLSLLPGMPLVCIDALFLRSPPLLDITHLQCLTLTFVKKESTIRQILEVCGQSLYTLKVHMHHRKETPNDKLDLGFQHLQRITSLTFSFSSNDDSRLLNLVSSSLPSPERLKHLTLVFEFYPQPTPDWSEDTWYALNALPVRLSGLWSVRLLFWLESCSGPTVNPEPVVHTDTLLKWVRERAVQLADTGVLEVDVISELPWLY